MASERFSTALEQNSYKDAKKMLQEFERWLRGINESAADSLLEALEEVLTLHRLKGSRPAAQEPAFDESYREHVLHGSELRAQYQTLP